MGVLLKDKSAHSCVGGVFGEKFKVFSETILWFSRAYTLIKAKPNQVSLFSYFDRYNMKMLSLIRDLIIFS